MLGFLVPGVEPQVIDYPHPQLMVLLIDYEQERIIDYVLLVQKFAVALTSIPFLLEKRDHYNESFLSRLESAQRSCLS